METIIKNLPKKQEYTYSGYFFLGMAWKIKVELRLKDMFNQIWGKLKCNEHSRTWMLDDQGKKNPVWLLSHKKNGWLPVSVLVAVSAGLPLICRMTAVGSWTYTCHRNAPPQLHHGCHVSIQMNVVKADKVTCRLNSQFKTYAICRAIPRIGESDDSIL